MKFLVTIVLYNFVSYGLQLKLRQKHDVKMSNTDKLIIGLNKYSHDTSCCVIDAKSGKILFAQAKERITRKKHDGGGSAEIVRYALDYLDASIDDVALVVSNNHHFRVHPFEKRLPFAAAVKYVPNDYLDQYNLLHNAKHMELSHHLAHAYSVAGTSTLSDGLILCMDGMGESYRAMVEDMIEGGDSSTYMTDLRALKSLSETQLQQFIGIPRNLIPGAGYREAESAYLMSTDSDGVRRLSPVFKRWCRERSPPELYNHGFENMDSMGEYICVCVYHMYRVYPSLILVPYKRLLLLWLFSLYTVCIILDCAYYIYYKPYTLYTR